MPKEKDVNITISHRKKRVPISDFSHHDLKTKEGLSKLRLIDLRALVVKHNLHAMIRQYSSLRKSQIVDILHSHTQKTLIKIKRMPQLSPVPGSPPPRSPPETPRKSPQKTPVSTPAKPTGRAIKPKALVPKRRGQGKPKLTAFDKAMGIGKPLFSNAEGGLVEGAKKQFEKKYPSNDAKFLKELGTKIAKENELGRGKRHKKKPAKLR